MNLKKLLITGGPVHGKLDDVKLVTNRFKGGMMAELAAELTKQFEVIYLTSRGATLPQVNYELDDEITIEYHDGFFDYHRRVLELAPMVDGVILGAAVANLIPQTPFPGKFPSHNYKPGDVVNIPFIIAPRVIDEVKKVAPKTRLFGFKLLSDVPREELIAAAWGVLTESKADFVFANDAKDLKQKFIVTRERGVIPSDLNGLAEIVKESMSAEFYSTVFAPGNGNASRVMVLDALSRLEHFLNRYNEDIVSNNGFGSVAVRLGHRLDNVDAFMTTPREKKIKDGKVRNDYVIVGVDHDARRACCFGEEKTKATLNAPLFAWLFKENPDVEVIVHLHKQIEGLETLSYYIPGSVADSRRTMIKSFNVAHHGCYLLNGV